MALLQSPPRVMDFFHTIYIWWKLLTILPSPPRIRIRSPHPQPQGHSARPAQSLQEPTQPKHRPASSSWAPESHGAEDLAAGHLETRAAGAQPLLLRGQSQPPPSLDPCPLSCPVSCHHRHPPPPSNMGQHFLPRAGRGQEGKSRLCLHPPAGVPCPGRVNSSAPWERLGSHRS